MAARAGPVIIAASMLAGCQSSLLDAQGPVGRAQATILINSVVIMLAIVVPTIVATLAFAWWFRASNTRARRRLDWSYSGQIELVTWSIPLLVILFLGGIAWVGSHDLDPSRPLASERKPLRVQVVSLDWKWLFIYPDHGVASVNEMFAPARTPISFELTSASVMNAFFVPQLGSMIYTMNGMATRLHLQADGEGEFLGLSTHFSGDGFQGMRFAFRSVGDDAFQAWVEGARGSASALDRAGYEELAKQSLNAKPASYRAVDPHLFHDIVSQAIPPSGGPEGGQPTPQVSHRSSTFQAPVCTPASPRREPTASLSSPRTRN
ncbi:ubiquinol oxidase subunit II [uncultured Enterovirga sp.]|uniref:ubiquinol oxidase subunit II n=1 Tax=uncultured Enterovirga sp. TaxID=2026352 RepID=UPI0035CA11DB